MASRTSAGVRGGRGSGSTPYGSDVAASVGHSLGWAAASAASLTAFFNGPIPAAGLTSTPEAALRSLGPGDGTFERVVDSGAVVEHGAAPLRAAWLQVLRWARVRGGPVLLHFAPICA